MKQIYVNEELINELATYLCGLSSIPSYDNEEVFDFELNEDYLDIIMCGSYHIELYMNEDSSDVAYVEGSGGYGYQDLLYAAEIMESKEELFEIINDNLKNRR